MDTPEIDQSLRKPRQLRGTPANRVSVLLSLGVLGAGCALGLFLHFSRKGQKVLEYVKTGELMQSSEAQLKHEASMRNQILYGVMNLRSTEEIKKRLDENAKNAPPADAPHGSL